MGLVLRNRSAMGPAVPRAPRNVAEADHAPSRGQQLRDVSRTHRPIVWDVSQHSLRVQQVAEEVDLPFGSALAGMPVRTTQPMLNVIVPVRPDSDALAALAQTISHDKAAESHQRLCRRIDERQCTIRWRHPQVIAA